MQPIGVWLVLRGRMMVVAALVAAAFPGLSVRADSEVAGALLNGKDLQGWAGDAKVWTVRDGAVRGVSDATPNAAAGRALTWSGGRLGNFALTFAFRVEHGTAAIRFRTDGTSGYRLSLTDSAETTGALQREPGGSSAAGVGEFVVAAAGGGRDVGAGVLSRDALAKAGVYKPGEWNQGKIVARGADIVVFINDRQVSELVDCDRARRADAGALSLWLPAAAGTVAEFKDLALTPIDAVYGEPIFLFNRKNLDGWTLSSDGLKDTWGVKDGVMTNTGRPGGYIRTTTDYTNYVLRLQLRHLSNGNGGVLLRMVGPDKVWPRSIEAQGMRNNMADIFIIDNFPCALDPERSRGRHVPKMHPSNEGELGEWSQYDITLDGGDLELRVNNLLQNGATDCWETPGKICLQSEGAQMEFRDLVLLPIVRRSPPALVLDNEVLQLRCRPDTATLTVMGSFRALLRDQPLMPVGGKLPRVSVVDIESGPLGKGQAFAIEHPGGLVEQVALYDSLPHVFVWTSPTEHTRAVLGVCAANGGGGVVTTEALGMAPGSVCAGYDRVGESFMGPVIKAFSLALPGAPCRVVSLRAISDDRPSLIDTSYGPGLAAGGLDAVTWDAAGNVMSGRVRMTAGRPYELRVFAPPHPKCWVASTAVVSDADRAAGVTAAVAQQRQWLRVTVSSPVAREVEWCVPFKTTAPSVPEKPRVAVTVEPLTPWSVRVSAAEEGCSVRLVRDGKTELPAGANPVVDDTVSPGTEYTYSAMVTTWQGETVVAGTATVKTPAAPPLPPAPDVYLSDLKPVKATVGWGGGPKMDTSIDSNPIRIRGYRFPKGVGVHAISELVYTLKPDYARFVAVVGVDDENNSGSVTFQVYADDRLLHDTGKLTIRDKRVELGVDIPKGARQLRLVVGDAGDGIGSDHADWAYAGFVVRK